MTRTGLSVTFTSSRQNIIRARGRAAIPAQALLGMEHQRREERNREFCSHEPPSFEPSIHYQPAEPDPRDGGKTPGRQMAAPGQK